MAGTLTPFIHRYVTERRARGELTVRTARAIRSDLSRLDRSFGDRPPEALRRRAIERCLEGCGHLAPSSRRNVLSAIRGFCRWLVDRKVIAEDPTTRIAPIRQPRSVPRALAADAVARLLAVLPDARARAIVWLMVGCGLRCIEVSRLTVGDYDPGARMLRVTGKGGHERELPVPVEVARAVDTYIDEVGLRSGPLIRSTLRPAEGLRAATLTTYVSRWLDAAGVKVGPNDGRSAHALRHTCASDVLDGGADLRVVQEMLGHQHLATTSIYLRRASIGQMRAAMEGREYREVA